MFHIECSLVGEAQQSCYDVIVAAGDRGKSRKIHGQNKAFLMIEGIHVINHILAALEKAQSVRDIYAVGPRDELERVVGSPNNPFRGEKKLVLLEQRRNLYENIWTTFLRTLPEGEKERPEAYIGTPYEDKAVLIVASDIPLVTQYEIDEFIHRCDPESFDYSLGVTSEKTLRAYYPRKRRRGIRMMYYHLREKSFRQNNLHFVKPFKVANRAYIQKAYDFRHQKEWFNILRLGWEILKTEEGTWKLLGQFFLLHLSASLHRMRLFKLHLIPRMFLRKARIEQSISRLLGTRFTSVETHYGGAALDIDTPRQYRIVQENFKRWMRHQQNIAKKRALPQALSRNQAE